MEESASVEGVPKTVAPRRLLVTAPGFDVYGEGNRVRLEAAGLTIDNVGPAGSRSPAEVAELVGNAVGAIVSSDPFTAAVFDQAPKLRVLARLGVGTDSVDVDAATETGVVVTTTPGLNDETCADHALGLMLAATRRIVEHDQSVRRGEWDRGNEMTPWDLHGKRVGVVGYGRIGRSVVRRLTGFGTTVKIFDPRVTPPAGSSCTSLDELLRWADIVTLHAPLTVATTGMIGSRELALMRPGATLVNTSRGGLVDEEALFAALTSGRLRAAAVDVFEDEPPEAAAWRTAPNVVLSPHIGGLSVEAIRAMARRCVDQVLDVLGGTVPEGAVNPEALERRRIKDRGGTAMTDHDLLADSPDGPLGPTVKARRRIAPSSASDTGGTGDQPSVDQPE